MFLLELARNDLLSKRKPILLIDDNEESAMAKKLLSTDKIDFVEYHIKKFEESCCGEIPSTKAPSIFAPEGVFKGLKGVDEFLNIKKQNGAAQESDSAYW
jgi:hypothetical protein